MIALRSSRVFDGRTDLGPAVLLLDGGTIVDIVAASPPGLAETILPERMILAPGYLDLQVNGGGGIMFNDVTTIDGLARIAEAHASAGTTGIMPTLITTSRPHIAQAIAAARSALATRLPGILGLHLEGPFIAPARRGIHPLAAVTAMTDDDVRMLTAPFPGPLVVTLAPDAVEPHRVAALVQAGIATFAGHSEATFEQAHAAFNSGVRGATHLFNAMSQLMHRNPGLVGAVLDHPRAMAGVIADGHHVHPASLRIALHAIGPDRLFLVSDAMATTASDITEFVLAGETIFLRDGRLTNAQGTLAGAHLTMAEAVRNIAALTGADWTVALRMATSTPAAALALNDRGTIAPGARADLVVLDDALFVHEVWRGGGRLAETHALSGLANTR